MEEHNGFTNIYMVEQALLARMVTCPSDRAVVALMLRREDFSSPVNGRLYSAILLYGLHDQTHALGLELAQMLEYVGDFEALHALVDLATIVDMPSCQLSLVQHALTIHDFSSLREKVRLHDLAVDSWMAEEMERAECESPEDEVPW